MCRADGEKSHQNYLSISKEWVKITWQERCTRGINVHIDASVCTFTVQGKATPLVLHLTKVTMEGMVPRRHIGDFTPHVSGQGISIICRSKIQNTTPTTFVCWPLTTTSPLSHTSTIFVLFPFIITLFTTASPIYFSLFLEKNLLALLGRWHTNTSKYWLSYIFVIPVLYFTVKWRYLDIGWMRYNTETKSVYAGLHDLLPVPIFQEPAWLSNTLSTMQWLQWFVFRSNPLWTSTSWTGLWYCI